MTADRGSPIRRAVISDLLPGRLPRRFGFKPFDSGPAGVYGR